MLSNVRSHATAILTLLLLAVVLVSGCGKGQDDVLLAQVGDREIRASEYEQRLANLEADELPRDDRGIPLDMAQQPGKEQFLTTLVNKELMVLKATQLGFDQEQRIVNARKSMMDYEAGLAMGQDVINAPAGEVSMEEYDAFYERMGEMRRCQYIVVNFEPEALAAREMILGGADWDDMADRYHAGDRPPSGMLEITIPWGRFDIHFEDKVFSTPEGDVSEPIRTDYGWWLVRTEEIIMPGNKPAKATVQAEVLDQLHRRKMQRLQKDFRYEIHEKFKVDISDEAAALVWEGLPEGEVMIDTATDKPIPQDQLSDLVVDIADLDMVFFSYELDGESHITTVGDFKSTYDRMNTFERPKREQMVGGLRTSILQKLERSLMPAEAEARGYFDDADVLFKVDKKIEELMITSLYSEVVTIDDQVDQEAFSAFWAEHSERFAVPERRSGRLVIAANQVEAESARRELAGGAVWGDIVQQYGTDPGNKARSGKLDEVSARSTGPVPEALFATPEGELGQVFSLGDDRWGVVRCERVLPGKAADPNRNREEIFAAVRAQRKEDLFQSLLEEWEVEFGVTRNDENLEHVKSWQELTYVEPAGAPVPRS